MGQAEYGDSGAPEAGTVTAEQKDADRPDNQGAVAAAGLLEKEDIAVKDDDGMVAYVASDEYANSRWLVKPGDIVKTAMAAGSTTGIIPLVTRTGDIWAKFVGGIMVTDVKEVIEWCSLHTDICRRSDDPMTRSWATMKSLQTRKANREQLVDASEMNADEAFPADLTEHIAAQAAKSGSVGSDAVDNAELTKASIRQQRVASE